MLTRGTPLPCHLLQGDVGKKRLFQYSRGVRQTLFNLSRTLNWAEKHKIMIGDREDLPEGYSEWLARSKYCLVAAGECKQIR